MKVLIVDDDKYVRIGLKNLIPWREMNFNEVYCADNGETAYDIVMKAYPDLIITDVRMPVMNGIELCKKIYEANVIDIYIIMLSAYDEFEFARAAITYNVKDYVLKPLDDDSISKLTAKIQVIANDLMNKHYYRNIRYNKELKSRVLNSLYELNTEDIRNLFLGELPSMHLKGNDKKDCCLFLIELLFDYLQEISCNDLNLYSKHRNEAVEYILNLPEASWLFKCFHPFLCNTFFVENRICIFVHVSCLTH
jgi:two-component system response regulator YesN